MDSIGVEMQVVFQAGETSCCNIVSVGRGMCETRGKRVEEKGGGMGLPVNVV